MSQSIDAGSFEEMAFRSNYPLHKACMDGDIINVQSILRSDPQQALCEDVFRNWTPIQWAAYHGQFDCLRQIASLEPNLIHSQSSKNFQTALHSASEGGHSLCVLWLLQAGVNSKVKDLLGETALHKASRVGNSDCVQLLLSAASDIRCQNTRGQTASMVAEECGHAMIAGQIRQHELIGSPPSGQGLIAFPRRVGRKRTRDAVCEDDDDISKRFRQTDDVSSYLESMTTSVVDHDNLLVEDSGYTSVLFEALLRECHGC